MRRLNFTLYRGVSTCNPSCVIYQLRPRPMYYPKYVITALCTIQVYINNKSIKDIYMINPNLCCLLHVYTIGSRIGLEMPYTKELFIKLKEIIQCTP